VQRRVALLEAEGAHESDHTQEVIAVKMREKNLGQREAHPVPHHLALRTFAAIDEQGLAFALERQGGDVALDRGTRGRRAEKGDGEHGRI
jgi:hypothetical protein